MAFESTLDLLTVMGAYDRVFSGLEISENPEPQPNGFSLDEVSELAFPEGCIQDAKAREGIAEVIYNQYLTCGEVERACYACYEAPEDCTARAVRCGDDSKRYM